MSLFSKHQRIKVLEVTLVASILAQQVLTADTTCSAGQYLKNGKACQACKPGYYCTGGTLTYMKKCSPGYYTAFGASSCTICPAGFACSDPSSPPVACQLGYYSIAGQASCYTCPSGSVCGANGVVTQCNPGQICRNSASMEVEKCPRGYRCPNPDDLTQIIACDDGYYAPESSDTCLICPVGSYCPKGSWTPTACPAGYYSSTPGSSSCTICETGYYCPSGSSRPYRCDLGQYSVQGLSSCIDCPAGFYCPDQEVQPIACPQGFYSSSTKQSYCISCPEGYSCTDRKSATACASGYYSLEGEESCKQCPAGYECGSWGNKMPCSPGMYSLPGATTCVYCPAGSMCPVTNSLPQICPLGTYQDEIGKTYCKTCPDGYTCTSLSAAPVACTNKEYTDMFHQTCNTCPAGYDCSTQKYEEMTFCQPGYYSPAGDNVCYICPAGYYCSTPESSPTACPSGTYSIEGQLVCTECPMGYDCLDQTGKYFVKCLEGQYYSSSTKKCTDCPAGYACPPSSAQVGYDVKYACPAGTYSIGKQVSCTICPPGKYCPSTTVATETDCVDGQISFGHATSCIDCPQNYECPTRSSLALCPTYFYSPAGQSKCVACPDGMNCIYPNATLAGSTCAPGYYMSTLDYTCQICPKGYSCTGGGVEPVSCPAGSYAPMLGMSECLDCPTGYYSISNAEFCQPAVPGSAAVSGVLTTCQETTYSDWGYSTCKTCEPGFLCPEGGMIGMHYSCPRGSYCLNGIQTLCPKGYYGLVERASSKLNGCGICPAGYFCLEGTENFELNPCPRGHYCPVMTGLPIECNKGSYNDRLYGLTIADCQLCPMGHQCANATQDQGEICQEGYYCPLGSYPQQYPCPAGTYGGKRTGLKDISECQICPAGYYCPSATKDPIPSPAGYYQPYSSIGDEDALIICPAKFYCPDEAMTNYKGYHCSAGYYCPAGSTSSTEEPCPEGTYSDSREIFDASHCLNCPTGFKCDEASTSQDFIDCPLNQYCPLRTKKSENYFCPAGTYAPYTNARALDECIPCPYGSYCLSGQDPVTCPKGHFCPKNTEYSTQYPCPKGHFLDYTGAQAFGECKPCGLGNYCEEGAIAQTQCSQGYYNDFSNEASACKKCNPGRYCPNLGTIIQPLCSAGFYSDMMATACTRCPVGHYCFQVGTTVEQMKAQLCPAGTFCSMDVSGTNYGLDTIPNLLDHYCTEGYYCPKGTTQKMACPTGTYNRVKGRKSVLDCLPIEGGQYVSSTAATAKSGDCEAGYYCPDGSTSATQIPCPIGTYRSIERGSEPKDCSICPSGYYCDELGMWEVKICPAGYYCPLGTIVPEPCPEGTYSNVEGLIDSRSCTYCPAGYYCPRRGQTSATDKCDKGYLCIRGSKTPDPTDTVTGSICPKGGYCPEGTPEVIACLFGTFNSFEGAESQDDCQTCWPGYYCQGSNLPEPTGKCPEGYYCLAGQAVYTTYESQAGYFASEGSQEQTECPVGTYQDEVNKGSCKSCEAGRYCPRTGMTTPEDCQAGHYCPSYDSFLLDGSQYQMLRCPVGTYQPSTNKALLKDCLPCTKGKYCAEEALSAVSGTCEAGYFCLQSAFSPRPSELHKYGYYGPCPAGKYCTAGSDSATDCPIGKFSTITNAVDDSVCQPCTAGFYCASTGLTEPTAVCDAGYYCPPGQTIPNDETYKCTQTYYCPQGASQQIMCPVGFYSDDTHFKKCTPCPSGSYCIFGNRINCPQGYYCS